jgi:hypothetical protein
VAGGHRGGILDYDVDEVTVESKIENGNWKNSAELAIAGCSR